MWTLEKLLIFFHWENIYINFPYWSPGGTFVSTDMSFKPILWIYLFDKYYENSQG